MERGWADLALRAGSLSLGIINYYWRLLATGACFAVFRSRGLRALGAGISSFWGSFLAVGVPNEPSGSSANRFAAFLWLMEAVGVMRMEVSGAEKLRKLSGRFGAGQPSDADRRRGANFTDAYGELRSKAGALAESFLGGVVRAAGYISNSDSDSLIDDCASTLKSGRSLVIFPEGSRTQPGEPLGFKRGAAYIAMRSGHRWCPC